MYRFIPGISRKKLVWKLESMSHVKHCGIYLSSMYACGIYAEEIFAFCQQVISHQPMAVL